MEKMNVHTATRAELLAGVLRGLPERPDILGGAPLRRGHGLVGNGVHLHPRRIFAVSVGTALTSAIIAEGVGYVVLLIPKRIKKLKDEGRAEERERVGKAMARFERGEITFDELRRLTSDRD